MAAEITERTHLDGNGNLDEGAGPTHRSVVDENLVPGRALARFRIGQRMRMRSNGEGSAFRYSVTITAVNWNAGRSGWDYNVVDSDGNPTYDVPQSDLQRDR